MKIKKLRKKKIASATLSFNFPDDRCDYNCAVNGHNWKDIVYKLDNFLRGKLKYEDLKDDEYELYDGIRTRLWELMQEQNITIDE